MTDEQGAVIPGVKVTITSPAMIEGSKTMLTNEAGRYAFVDLRPGTYGVTFVLKGFVTVERPGIEVTAQFTAPVNAVMKVAGIEDVVVVEAAPPVVDVQSVATPHVQTRTVLDAIPTNGRSQNEMALTLPGATLTDFGDVTYHGTPQSLTMVDGIRATNISIASPSQSGNFSNEMFQVMSFSTAIDNAEISQPGLLMNLIPREGGNEFHGSVFFNVTSKSWNASNGKGIKERYAVDLGSARTLRYYDINSSVGGPVKRDKLWFQATGRYNTDKTEVLNAFANKSKNPTYYEPDYDRPGFSVDRRAQPGVPPLHPPGQPAVQQGDRGQGPLHVQAHGRLLQHLQQRRDPQHHHQLRNELAPALGDSGTHAVPDHGAVPVLTAGPCHRPRARPAPSHYGSPRAAASADRSPLPAPPKPQPFDAATAIYASSSWARVRRSRTATPFGHRTVHDEQSRQRTARISAGSSRKLARAWW